MDKIINGLECSKKIKASVKEEIDVIRESGERIPNLCVILVGNNPASLSYIKGKEKACSSVGMNSTLVHLEENASTDEIISVIKEKNADDGVDGILLQLPLPNGQDEKRIISEINYQKDVDGLHPINMGKLLLGEDGFVPCTPLGIIELLDDSNISLSGKEVVVIGRSALVGKSVAQLLLNRDATVTMCHSKTKDLKEVCKRADILVVAMGKSKFINKEYLKDNAVVIDVGINRGSDNKLVGDVDFDDVIDKVLLITPVPRGVGPMTIAMLIKNTLKAYRKR
ncbi:MAG: bifunctional methylenetetrahydrofolate dehydrogenase/methenyltetrahydrofolate cyclohydrolase FolD [Anaerorhabdus sp.]